MNFHQHVHVPTHCKGHTLDLIITHGLSVKVDLVEDLGISDHSCISFTTNDINKQETPKSTSRKRHINDEVTANFANYLQNAPTVASLDCNSMVTNLNTKLSTILDKVAPTQLRKTKTKKCPWKTKEVWTLRRECRISERKWRKTKLVTDYESFRGKLALYNKEMKKCRQKYFSNIITEHNNNPRVLFSTIQKLINPSVKTSNCFTKEKCQEFADHFKAKIDMVRLEMSQSCTENFDSYDFRMFDEELGAFDIVEATTLKKVISQIKSTTCTLDPIPTTLFKKVCESCETEILNIVNSSLQSGDFPASLKTAVVRPTLKKNNLDVSALHNYRPVSNLSFLSKVIEKLVFYQLTDFLKDNNICEKFQSGFKSDHSTETALVRVVSDLRMNADRKNLSVLVLLDLTAAFDTVDHSILLKRLCNMVGLTGTVFSWLKSYLTNRTFFVSSNETSSSVLPLTCGIPQGSILGPTLFNLYMLPLGNIIRRHGINFHSYADDTQLYVAVSPDEPTATNKLINCINDIKDWMAANFLKLNKDKTEIMIIGPEADRERARLKCQNFGMDVTSSAKNLGVVFDADLNFKQHILNVTKTAFFHLKNIAKVLPFLTRSSAEILIHAFISSRLDYCNALLTGLPKQSVNKLQLIQNSAARLLTNTRRRAHITPVLKSLHWLPVSFRIDFKIILLVFKCLNGSGPLYLLDLLSPYEPPRALRSSGSTTLIIPRTRTKTYGEASFQCLGPRLWNSLPEDLRACTTVEIFKNKLKTHLFSKAFNDSF
uniref:Reverse transcriptase domain-containing protein n=1 Tax=Oryzias melastigma TaxID=30732 RepID=A0A3B3CU78_ORYME